MKRFHAFAALLLLFVTSLSALGGPTQGGNQASAKLYHHVDGDCVQLAIEIRIGFGWHLYHDDLGNPDAIGKPTVIELSGEGLEFTKPLFPEPHKLEQPGLGTWIYGHEGRIVIYAAARGGKGEAVRASLSGLTCEDEGTCILYDESITSEGDHPELFKAFPADLCAQIVESGGGADSGGGGPGDGGSSTGGGSTTAGGGGADHGSESTGSRGSTGATGAHGTPGATDVDYDAVQFRDFLPQNDPIERSLFLWLLIAFLAGMILNVMPCVLPVISIKILSFVQQAGEDRARIFKLGLAFAAGILVIFVVLAILAVSAGLSWGEQFQDEKFLIAMIAVVFAFALSMFGVYELGVPQAVGAAASGPPREGLVDAFFKGMLATLLATPCSGPFLGSTLTWTLSQPPATVVSIFVALGLGMAFPYVVLTAQPALLKLVPKPGPWMETFKQSMGFVLMATVVYLFISLRADYHLFTFAFLVFVGLGCWWWGRFATYEQSTPQRIGTLGMCILIVALGAQLSFKNFRGLFLAAHTGEVEWLDFDAAAFQEGLGQESIFVDFTADWCPNCKYNEALVYNSDEVQRALADKGVVVYKADITHKNPRTDMLERLMSKLGAVSIPFMAVFPKDNPDQPIVRFDIVKKDDMLGIVNSLP